jgi:hypothetical protein
MMLTLIPMSLSSCRRYNLSFIALCSCPIGCGPIFPRSSIFREGAELPVLVRCLVALERPNLLILGSPNIAAALSRPVKMRMSPAPLGTSGGFDPNECLF